MTAPQLPEARLREIAATGGAGWPMIKAIAAELLAARETIERLTNDLSLPGYNRLVAERDAARAELEELRTGWFGIAGGERLRQLENA